MGELFKTARSEDWRGKIRLAAYEHKPAKYCTDKETSRRWHALLQAAVDRAASGEPPRADVLKELPRRLLASFGLVSELAEKRRAKYLVNVDDYVRELRTSGRDGKYVANAERYLKSIGAALKWRLLTDISRDSILKHAKTRRDGGAAARTVKNELSTVRAFVAWAVAARRLDSDPLVNLPRFDLIGDKRRQRRAFTRDELNRLLAIAGPRELLYRLAVGTGLRRRELQRLQWRDVLIDDVDRPCIALRAEVTKSKRADVVPLHHDLRARLLAARPADFTPTMPVFKRVCAWDTWCVDLDRAGLKYVGDDGKMLGFHSLRTTFATELERAGASPRTIMQLMRHTDYRLTASTYTDVRVLDTFGAVEKIRLFDPTEPASIPAAKTGTDDRPVEAVAARDQGRDQKPRVLRRCTAQIGASKATAEGAEKPTKIGVFARIGEGKENSPSRTRTYNNPVNSRVLYH